VEGIFCTNGEALICDSFAVLVLFSVVLIKCRVSNYTAIPLHHHSIAGGNACTLYLEGLMEV
jgi:hypothetical protein